MFYHGIVTKKFIFLEFIVRYADDSSIYVRNRKSAHRVMANISGYLEEELKLKVNREKSKVSEPLGSTLLGFSFYKGIQGWEVRGYSGAC